MKGLKNNQKGFSLIELLVSLAVGSIVIAAVLALVTQATKGYRIQTETAQLQNDANIAMTQIEKNVMEGNVMYVGVDTGSSGNTEYMVSMDQAGGAADIVYYYDNDKLYIQQDVDGANRSVVCENVKSFRVRISTDAVNVDGSTMKSVNRPIQVEVYMKLEKNGITRENTKKINMRNNIQIEQVQVGSGKSFDTISGKDMSVLMSYFFRPDV